MPGPASRQPGRREPGRRQADRREPGPRDARPQEPDRQERGRQQAGGRPSRWGRDAAKYLLTDEEPVIATRRHWAVLSRPAVRGVPLLAVGVGLLLLDPTNRVISTVGLLVALGALGYLAVYVAEWRVRYLLITRRRVLLTSGVIIRRVAMMPLRRITDLTYQETLFGQLLGYGTFRFESAGQDQGLDVIDYVPQPDGFYRRLSQLMFGTDVSTNPVGDDDDGTGSSEGSDPPGRRRSPPRTPPRAAPPPPPASGRHDTAPIPRLPPSAPGDD